MTVRRAVRREAVRSRPDRPHEPPLTVLEAVRRSTEYLGRKGVENSRLDAEHILSHVLEMGRLQLYLHFDRPLSSAEMAACRPLLRRRAAREPLQYVLGTAPFRNLELTVGPGVAVPRPETEHMLDALLDLLDTLLDATGRGRDSTAPFGSAPFGSALDIGTGSGALALALADEKLADMVVATDVSSTALAAARRNAAQAGIEAVEFRKGPLLEPVAGATFDLIVSNPPYLTTAEWRSAAPEVREWEPRVAMEAGQDGLDVIRPLIRSAVPALRPGGWIGLEVGRSQTGAVASIFREAGAGQVVVREDLAGLPRYVFAQSREEPAVG